MTVSEEATDYCFIKYWSQIYGNDSFWKRSHFLEPFIQQLGNSHSTSDFLISQQSIHNHSCGKSHFPCLFQTHQGSSPLDAWENWRWNYSIGICPNSGSSHRHFHQTVEFRKIPEIPWCIGISPDQCTLSGHVGNQHVILFMDFICFHLLLFTFNKHHAPSPYGVGGITIQYPACLYSQVLMPTAIQQFSSPIQCFFDQKSCLWAALIY